MKAQFLVIGLEEPELVKSAWLSSNGVNTTEEFFLIGKHQKTFDTELEAMTFAETIVGQFEHGVEIRKVFVKKG